MTEAHLSDTVVLCWLGLGWGGGVGGLDEIDKLDVFRYFLRKCLQEEVSITPKSVIDGDFQNN